MKLIFLSIFLISNSFASTEQFWVFSSDRKDRPINECIPLSSDGFYGAAIAMNCQKSIDSTKFLCSQGRILHKFIDKKSCIKSNSALTTLWGKYSLKTDSHEK